MVLYIAPIIFSDQDKFEFYINNYIDLDPFNQLYNHDWMDKGEGNANVVACKLGPALKRATNHKLEVTNKKREKIEEMMKRKKIKAIAAKGQRNGGEISLSSEKKRNSKSNIIDKIDSD